MQNDRPLSAGRRISLKNHLLFTAAGLLTLMVMHSLLRLALLAYNREQIGGTSAEALAEAFFNGLRFDLRLAIFACIPLLLALPSLRAMNSARTFFRHWLTAFASITFFLGVVELDFYREFNQRLNGLVFQYLKEDPGTVLSMIWYGFPVLRYLLAWAAATGLLVWIFAVLDRRTRPRPESARVLRLTPSAGLFSRLAVFLVAVPLAVVAARGTLHFRVAKQVVEGRTQSAVVRLSPEERVDELSRMLAGDAVTAQTAAFAEELLAKGGAVR